ncbi:Myb family transcription factor EFM [Euphorbia peplus]|nr:Myb family transcription factor EFM [Euphorbia peplus]
MSSPSELTLDCKPHTYSMLLKSFGEHNHNSNSNNNNNDQTQKLEQFLSRLEDERQKIDVFKRELPLCMQLLTNAVETSRQQLQAYRGNQGGGRPVLEEFIPLKNDTILDKTSNISDKVNWMTTAQLWSHDGSETKPQPQPTLTGCGQETTNNNNNNNSNIGFNVSPKLCLDTKQRNGGAFLPFSKERNLCSTSPTTLALSSPDKQIEDQKCLASENGFCNKSSNGGGAIEQGKEDGQTTNHVNGTNSQTHRKARRCWSPDLHRRFVNALQMLGGSQVATPKQIRELMKVDGLTNDEVKSHLQKYRLHTRRPSPSPQAAAAPAAQLVVLGGIWVPPEYATAAHGGGPTLYGHHHHAPPPHFMPTHQDFYTTTTTTAPPSHQLHHHTLHHQLHMYKATSQPHSTPDSDLRGTTGDRSESIEDGKSESSSWKNDNNEAERKGLAALRDDGEESNGSEITLKF